VAKFNPKNTPNLIFAGRLPHMGEVLFVAKGFYYYGEKV
jgi:hypothetical protein